MPPLPLLPFKPNSVRLYSWPSTSVSPKSANYEIRKKVTLLLTSQYIHKAATGASHLRIKHILDSLPSFHMTKIPHIDVANEAPHDQLHPLPAPLPPRLPAPHLLSTPWSSLLHDLCMCPAWNMLSPHVCLAKFCSHLMSQLKVTLPERFSLVAPNLNEAHLLISFMVSCLFPYQTLS